MAYINTFSTFKIILCIGNCYITSIRSSKRNGKQKSHPTQVVQQSQSSEPSQAIVQSDSGNRKSANNAFKRPKVVCHGVFVSKDDFICAEKNIKSQTSSQGASRTEGTEREKLLDSEGDDDNSNFEHVLDTSIISWIGKRQALRVVPSLEAGQARDKFQHQEKLQHLS
ncbi:hypothetical protein RDI58_013387 [Solanum bulbocastanum]|uniref:Uncharacterized protein n=1 Tax=Solanum bulbocastanum TaxID=147425 RepID=A0AAN8TQM0_SOLBU